MVEQDVSLAIDYLEYAYILHYLQILIMFILEWPYRKGIENFSLFKNYIYRDYSLSWLRLAATDAVLDTFR